MHQLYVFSISIRFLKIPIRFLIVSIISRLKQKFGSIIILSIRFTSPLIFFNQVSTLPFFFLTVEKDLLHPCFSTPSPSAHSRCAQWNCWFIRKIATAFLWCLYALLDNLLWEQWSYHFSSLRRCYASKLGARDGNRKRVWPTCQSSSCWGP